MRQMSVREGVELRAGDLLSLSEKRGSPVFTDFLNEQEQLFAERFLTAKKAGFAFWGGHEECTRKMLCISPSGAGAEDFPVFALTVSFRRADTVSHREILGSFLSLGLGREQIGDIFTGEGHAVTFCTKTARDLICSCVTKVGRVGVSVEEGVLSDIPAARFEEVAVVIASMRADCVVSSVTGLSREKTSELIRGGRFMLNYEECTSISRTLIPGDIISLRGYGKFVVTDDAGETKKGRIRLRLKKYN